MTHGGIKETSTSATLDEYGSRRLVGGLAGVAPFGSPPSITVKGLASPGVPLHEDSLFPLRCAVKPLVAVALLSQLAKHGLSTSARVGDVLSDTSPDVGRLSFEQVLTHTGGLPGEAPEGRPYALSRDEVTSLARHSGVVEEHQSVFSYSTTLSWHLLGLVVETLAGQGLARTLERDVLSPCGMTDTHLTITGDARRAVQGGLLVPAVWTGSRRVFVTDLCSPKVLSTVNPAWGGFSTTRDMLQFYVAAGKAVTRGEGPLRDVIPEMARMKPLRHVDGRTRPFGLSLFFDMCREGASARCSPRSFGHGGSVNTAGRDYMAVLPWVDLDAEAAFCIVVSGYFGGSIRWFPALARALYDELPTLPGGGP